KIRAEGGPATLEFGPRPKHLAPKPARHLSQAPVLESAPGRFQCVGADLLKIHADSDPATQRRDPPIPEFLPYVRGAWRAKHRVRGRPAARQRLFRLSSVDSATRPGPEKSSAFCGAANGDRGHARRANLDHESGSRRNPARLPATTFARGWFSPNLLR